MAATRTRRASRAAALALLLLTVCASAACTRRTQSPEDEIRAFLARTEKATRDRDAAEVKALIADDYADGEGRDKRALAGLAAFHFMQGGSLHIATRLQSVSFPQRDVASAEVIAAVGRTEIDLRSLPQVDAEVYRFTLDLRRRGGEWQVTRASWRQATVDDLQ